MDFGKFNEGPLWKRTKQFAAFESFRMYTRCPRLARRK